MSDNEKPKLQIDPYSDEWETRANNLARSWVDVTDCKNCGYPVVRGYQCGNIHCPNPSDPSGG